MMFLAVAPHAGAWIETVWRGMGRGNNESRPMRARGLKPGMADHLLQEKSVAPHAGAWIETWFAGTH